MEKAVPVGLVIGQLVQGGAERQLVALLRGIDRRRFAPVVLCLSEATEPLGREVRALEIPVVTFRRRGHFDLLRVLSLARECRRREIRLLHAFLLEASIYAALARRLARTPRLISSNRVAWPGRGRVRRLFDRWALRGSDRILVNSEDVLRFTCREYGLAAERFRVVPNGLDPAPFESARPDPALRERFAGGPGRWLVGTIGRLVPQKNPALFLEVVTRVAARLPEARFVWIGGGERREWLAAGLRDRGLDGVTLLAGPSGEIPRVMKSLDVVLQTSDAEGLPNVVLEAMASGRYVVATDVGGTREALGHLGKLCPPGDPDALAEGVAAALEQPALREEAAVGGPRRVHELFALPVMVRATEALYDDVMGGPSGGGR